MYKVKLILPFVLIFFSFTNSIAQKIGSLATDGNSVYARSNDGNFIKIIDNGNSFTPLNCPFLIKQF